VDVRKLEGCVGYTVVICEHTFHMYSTIQSQCMGEQWTQSGHSSWVLDLYVPIGIDLVECASISRKRSHGTRWSQSIDNTGAYDDYNTGEQREYQRLHELQMKVEQITPWFYRFDTQLHRILLHSCQVYRAHEFCQLDSW